MNDISNCIVCNKPLSGKQRSFCSIKCKNDHFMSYDILKKRASIRKAELIDSLGGCCHHCGYNDTVALSFYDKAGRTLHVDTNVLANSNLEKLKKKLKNAQVLCRNCAEERQNLSTSSSPTSQLKSNQLIGDLDSRPPSLSTPRVGDLRGNDGGVNNLTKRFTKNLALCGVKAGQTVILGVSGGVDSIVMLDLFAKSDLKLNIIVAHMNHGVREEAALDEKLVAELAKKHGFKFVSKKIKRPTSGNLEEQLRNARREFLLTVANDNKADFLALAHNANDQAETFILNAVRGSGPAGLGAMSMSDGQLIRPLLNFSRNEIEAYARANKLTWHEDVTNEDIDYNRNYVRHRILPLLTRLNPEYLSAIHRTTHLQRQIDEHFKEEAWRVIANTPCHSERAYRAEESLSNTAKGSLRCGRDDNVIDTDHLRRLDKPLLYEVLGLLYEEVKGDRQNLSLTHLSAIESLISSGSGTKTLDLPENIIVRRTYDKLDFYRELSDNIPSTPSTKSLRLGTQIFGDWKIDVEPTPLSSPDVVPNSLAIDAGMLPNLTIRTRKPGDRIASIGLSGTKKLQDLFVDAKIDRVKRDIWPIVVDSNDKVLWVPGLAKALITTKTDELLTLRIVEVDHEANEKK